MAVTLKNTFACAFCQSPVAAGKTCPFCIRNHFLDRLAAATSYEDPLVEKIVKTMKYRFVKSLADEIAGPMVRYLEKMKNRGLKYNPSDTLVAPVPLHRRRLNWRGFNQSELIGRAIGKGLGIDFLIALSRTRHTIPQAEIQERGLRIENVKNVFSCSEPELVRGRTILLVDDVYTTGSTLDDCARALKSAGAKEVIGFVFARGKI